MRRGGLAGCTAALLLLSAVPARAQQAPAGPLAAAERAYEAARYWDDRVRLVASLASDTTPDAIPARQARDSLALHARRFRAAFARLGGMPLDSTDRAVHAVLARAARRGFAPADPGDGEPIPARCRDGTGPSPTLVELTALTMACYGEAANRVLVEGDTLNRLAVLGRLGQADDSATRRRLFLALAPVWASVNGDNRPDSRYRTLLRLRRAAWGTGPTPMARKGPAFGLPTETLEEWLVAALSAWRRTGPDHLLEPWDWYHANGAASRRLGPRIATVAAIEQVNRAFHAALGADLDRLGVHFDLAPRPGKYPVAYTDFGAHRRVDAAGRLHPAEPWVFASYLEGGLDNLAELLHETGHAIHIAAIRGPSALADWPDNDTFTEALADLAAQEAYEPAWQLRFLGDSAPIAASLRARYAGIMLDMAWALFELRVHRTAAADPNRVWADITSTYLGIRPHPEWAWWALRGQLVEDPGYLINYALGAFMVADIRARVLAQLGPGAWTDPGTYPVLSRTLYQDGLARPSRAVLEAFLGRPLSSEALLTDLGRLHP
ncbi:MAG: hypothetical protein IPO73_16075 [Gemmatimonadetes bacterium]|nr:hypothetical protein [Gemmatimonadota bacterium]